MNKNVKSGKEILDDFFDNIQNLEGVDPEIAEIIADLYTQNKLTDTNLKNGLQQLRREATNEN